jgi:hypothetical protein
LLFQANSVANAVQPTVLVLATIPIIDPVAVADVEPLLAAIPPDRELHEPGKYLRKIAIELPSVDLLGDETNDVGAAAWLVAAGTVGMGRFKPPHDSGSSQKIVNQGIDGD